MAYKTPGVYVKEVSIFPPSVAEVETAIPAFIGYTERAEKNGESLLNKPTKISSLLEYNTYFGGAHQVDSVDVEVDENNNYAVTDISIEIRFHLYQALRLFFDNGGGECYIVSVGLYRDISSGSPVSVGDENNPAASPGFRVGIKALEQYDEPTMILFPDAVELGDENQFYGLQQMALAQCNKLQDRVSIFDLKENISSGWQSSVDNFRNGIGINNLKYGAAYTPFLEASYPQTVPFAIFKDNVEDSTAAAVDLGSLTTDSDLNSLVSNVNEALDDYDTYLTAVDAVDGTADQKNTIGDVYKGLRDTLRTGTVGNAGANLGNLLNVMVDMLEQAISWQSSFNGANLKNDLEAYAKDSLAKAAQSLIALEKNNVGGGIIGLTGRNPANIYGAAGIDLDATGWLGTLTVATIAGSPDDYSGADDKETALNALPDINDIFQQLMGFYDSIASAARTHINLTQNTLYQTHPIIGNIVKHIRKTMAVVPPSGAVAGLYSYVDNNRGVWKAPANVSVSSVVGPIVIIDNDIQEDLNVDANAGKSINAIRSFTGKGTLVWGARTLAGNDNEWRYISVRRFFNMVEESVKKSTGWAVFEPNDATTWGKVRSMISNYLLQKWKEGALQGATPDDAYFVKVGLGLTMTYDDILNGIMKVEIGMAVVRPAEFIILSFSHKMVENA